MIDRATNSKLRLKIPTLWGLNRRPLELKLVDNIEGGEKAQILMGATGTGKLTP